ncbi:hypothetical protein LVK10_10325 [Tenacibaculum maritimum]|nr:hypothetical protein [Tenacibaculum maritimum]MCD9614290.1 hypothetical protein [Tenacibaculum maritimum]CAA0199245.1 conserved membrane protein. Putative O-antigen biosynthesis protein [Tenacibaculum maritimum]
MFQKLIKLLKNKVFFYTSSRYATYGLQFLNSLLIAKYLGVYYLGVWGFVMLVLQYLLRMNFGISNATNAIASIHKSDFKYVSQVIGVGVTLLCILSFLISLFFLIISFLPIDIGSKYLFGNFVPYVVMIAILNHFNLFFSNVFRVFGKLGAIVFNQTAQPLLMFFVIMFYKEEELLLMLIKISLVASLLSFLFYLLTSPVSFKPFVSWKLIKEVQVKGIYLFIYNACFYLIIITTRTFVGNYYSVNEFGYFTFAFTLASSVLLLFESMSFLIFPKLLNRFSKGENQKTIELLNFLRGSYITISHFSIHLIILFYPLLLLYFPVYNSTVKVFSTIALTAVIYINSFGYQELLIAKEKEKKISLVAFLALVLNIFLNYIFVIILKLNYEYIILATMITYCIYIFVICYLGRKLIHKENSFKYTFLDVFPLKWMLPFILSFVITIFYNEFNYLYLGPLILFLSLNAKGIMQTWKLIKSIFKNSKIVDV